MEEYIISVRGLEVSFPHSTKKKNISRIIRGVDFDIPKASIVGFIGESGSGKSVTAKSLLNINGESITIANKMDIDGISILEKNKSKKISLVETENLKIQLAKTKDKDKRKDILKKIKKIRDDVRYQQNENSYKLSKSKSIWKKIRGKKVAYIPQDSMTSLNPTKTIGKQIMESLKLHSDIKSENKRKEKAIELLERFGVDRARERINSYPYEFSGGMRQRVIIAMTVACYPDVIIADEPTTALDPTVQASVLELFEEIRRDYGISIIFISHDIAVIATLCKYIYVFYAGRVIEKAYTEDLFSNPKHPYTWSLMAAIPDTNSKQKRLFTIPGSPPSFDNLPEGDPFSVRNPFALKIDFIKEPPLFKVSDNHYAATWTLHPQSPKIEPPQEVKHIITNSKRSLNRIKKGNNAKR